MSYSCKTKLLNPRIYLNFHPTAAVTLNNKLARGLGAGQGARDPASDDRIHLGIDMIVLQHDVSIVDCITARARSGVSETCKNMTICMAGV